LKELEDTEKFVADLAKKCGLFLEWTSNQREKTLAEQLWKNEMFLVASQKYPELTNEEIERLVDRDWNCMHQSER
jgi:hypothetical protein